MFAMLANLVDHFHLTQTEIDRNTRFLQSLESCSDLMAECRIGQEVQLDGAIVSSTYTPLTGETTAQFDDGTAEVQLVWNARTDLIGKMSRRMLISGTIVDIDGVPSIIEPQIEQLED